MKCWFINIIFKHLTHWANEAGGLTSISFPIKKRGCILKRLIGCYRSRLREIKGWYTHFMETESSTRYTQLHNRLCHLLCFYDQTYHVSVNSLFIICIISWQVNKKVIIGILSMQMNRLRLRKWSYCLPAQHHILSLISRAPVCRPLFKLEFCLSLPFDITTRNVSPLD